MGSVTHNLLKFFRGSSEQAAAAAATTAQSRISRRSSGLGELTRRIAGQEGLCILDLGCTSAANISRFANAGHKMCTEDILLAAQDPSLAIVGEDGKPTLDAAKFLAENLTYTGPQFDAVLCWDVPDYLPEPLVKPVIGRLAAATKPGGILLAFFHTRDAGPDAPCFRYHIVESDMMQCQPLCGTPVGRNKVAPPMYRLQRVFNNRHIENLFKEFASLKFFLARDNVREVLVVR